MPSRHLTLGWLMPNRTATDPSDRDSLPALGREVEVCRRCPRLVSWRESIAAEPPRRHRGEDYWARPITGFGDPDAAVVLTGLAPAANGANRTGRIFTGDRSGDWLFAALHRCGFANQPQATDRDDGLKLTGAYVTSVVRCAPPANRPTPAERDRCMTFLVRELRLLGRARVLLALGGFGWDGALRAVRELGHEIPRPKPRFGHGAEVAVGPYVLLGTFHPSQQNTFTGRLTEPMLDQVLNRARAISLQPI